MFFSIIIPVYNRPDEIKELLESLLISTYTKKIEIVIIEDGSTLPCDEVVAQYQEKLAISYYQKSNTGPGNSRNFGMQKAEGDYFIIFDSDCIIPPSYLENIEKQLNNNFTDCYGGPDKALNTFSNIQKAINFAMTSFLTTGGIRGGSERLTAFQPRSFNMGISKKAFDATKGFGTIHPGEDPDLVLRLWKLGFKTQLFVDCFVYHKRRIDWDKYENQVSKFGKVRPILNIWHPEYVKIAFWFPTLFIIGFFLSIVMLLFAIDLPLKLYFIYFGLLFLVSSFVNRSIIIGFLSIKAVWKQFYGYGLGFLESYIKIAVLKKNPKATFPNLFFEKIIDTKIIGLTGGIGSGKTALSTYIQSKGIPVYVSDIEAKKVMELPNVIAKIVAVLGSEILNSDQTINRNALSDIVFKNSEKLKLLNAIVHPEVKKHFDKWVVDHKNYLFIIKETAILFESGSYKDCDVIISITAPLETRIERVIQRDKTTREQVMSRIKNQLSDEERVAKSDFVITNIDLEVSKQKMDEILKKISIQ